MNKWIVAIIIIVLAGLALWAVQTNQFSTIGTGDTQELDTGVSCSTVNDCTNKIAEFPSNGYCKEGTCRFVTDLIKEVS